MTTCDRHEVGLALYVEGDLPPSDLAALERHLETCPRCRAFLRELETSQGALKALAAEPLSGGALEAVRARVLAEARWQRTSRPAIPKWAWGSAAVIACLALGGGLVWNQKSTARRRTVADASGSTPPGALAPPPAAAPAARPQSQTSPRALPAPATSGRPLVAARAPTSAPGVADLPQGERGGPGGSATAPSGTPNARPGRLVARPGARSAPQGPTETAPRSTLRGGRAVYGSEGSATTEAESALTPEEADQLARAVVVLSRIERLSGVPEGGDERTGGPLAAGEREKETPHPVVAPTGTLVLWTTADPDVVIYWQLDSNGGDS